MRRTNRSPPSQRRGTSPEDLRERILERQRASSFAGTRERLAIPGGPPNQLEASRQARQTSRQARQTSGLVWHGGLPGSRLVWRGVASAWSGGGWPLPGLAGVAPLPGPTGGAPRLVRRGCTPPGPAGVHPAWSGGGCTLLATPGGARAHVRQCASDARFLPVSRAFDSVFEGHVHLTFLNPSASGTILNVSPDIEFQLSGVRISTVDGTFERHTPGRSGSTRGLESVYLRCSSGEAVVYSRTFLWLHGRICHPGLA
ncbi:hypothetical protein Taro_026834 [Colocasia esculenta]|uniref:Uncharacterized protein n=1 Tax=Colocasia esculenta TaxID=4460 RepID=A0A843V758_COLES|nr:hypothetical protein [Colocasia esculenta]